MNDDTLFTARAVGDGTDVVEVRLDAKTALQLATAWEHVHRTRPENVAVRPDWVRDVVALKTAAADAAFLGEAAALAVPYSPNNVPGAPQPLRVVGGTS